MRLNRRHSRCGGVRSNSTGLVPPTEHPWTWAQAPEFINSLAPSRPPSRLAPQFSGLSVLPAQGWRGSTKMTAKPKRKVRKARAKVSAPAPKSGRRRPQATHNKRDPGVTKIDAVVAALRAPGGASITDLMTLTGWQMHSVRGAIAGTLKRKRGLTVTSIKRDGERVYRIEGRQ